ncbi:hypothetical protein JB92DRAFT_3185487 [Gautieria morchelliformis]|nr:hypothetical protein JB92DRAFT_3185487 [Gautieria morchelliformis]
MIYETHSVPPPVLNTSRSTKPLLLDSIKHLAPVWKDMGHVLTTKLPDWFDAQFNDYNPYRTITSASVDQSWFGHPNDMPIDVRAQPFILFWNETSGLSLQGCQVTLVLEAYADDLTRVTVWQSGTHEDANPTELLWSQRLRNLVSEWLRLVGVKATTVMCELVNQYRTPLLTSRPMNAATDISDNFPTFRRPTAKQIRQLLPAIVRRARLYQDPFTAVTILKNHNLHKIYNFIPHNSRKPDNGFTLENLILHGTCDGLAADTSWRNKNENRAAVTFLRSISINTLCQTLATYLEATVKVGQRAKEINTAKRTRSTLDAGLNFDFFREHSQYLDNVDAYIIGSSCASRLACVLRETHGIQGHLEQTKLVFGPGCTILAYYLLANRLGLGAEETYMLADQGHLYQPSSDHELVWEAMRGRVSLSVKGHNDFERMHRIMDATIKLPGIEVSFASDPKAHIEETPSCDVDKRDADAGHSKELVPQEAVTVFPKPVNWKVLMCYKVTKAKLWRVKSKCSTHSPNRNSTFHMAHPSSDAVSLSVVQQSSPRVYMTLDSADVSNARESESVERARVEVEHAATNKTRETRLSLAIDAAPEAGSALATDQLPLIQLVKTAEGWKASAGALPHGKLQAQDTSGDGLATNHTGTQKTSNPKRKRSPEGVLAPADIYPNNTWGWIPFKAARSRTYGGIKTVQTQRSTYN